MHPSEFMERQCTERKMHTELLISLHVFLSAFLFFFSKRIVLIKTYLDIEILTYLHLFPCIYLFL